MVSIEKMNYSNSIEFYVRATGAWLLFSILIESVEFLYQVTELSFYGCLFE